MREPDDRLAAIQCRDPAALDGVVRECLPGLLRAARAAGLDWVAAEDTVQEVFLTFLRRAHEFDGRARVSTWLFGILYRKVWEARRTAARDDAQEDIEAVVEARFDAAGRWVRPPRGPETDLMRAEIRRALGECLEGVPERQRLVFHLREVEGLSTDEICKAVDVTPNHLGVLLYRARNRLRECLEQKGFERSGDATVS
jgi:RNA polymerase sigma-70 factor (ECF subfamily)